MAGHLTAAQRVTGSIFDRTRFFFKSKHIRGARKLVLCTHHNQTRNNNVWIKYTKSCNVQGMGRLSIDWKPDLIITLRYTALSGHPLKNEHKYLLISFPFCCQRKSDTRRISREILKKKYRKNSLVRDFSVNLCDCRTIRSPNNTRSLIIEYLTSRQLLQEY